MGCYYQARSCVLKALGQLVECRQTTLQHLELYFGRCQDTEEAQVQIGKSLQRSACPLRILKIPSFNLGDVAVAFILQGLSGSVRRQTCQSALDDNGIRHKETIANPFQPQLRKLDLSGNDLSSNSLLPLSAMLLACAATLQTLVLDVNPRLFDSCCPMAF